METYQIVSLVVVGVAFIGLTLLNVATSRKWLGKRTYRKMFPEIVLSSVLLMIFWGGIYPHLALDAFAIFVLLDLFLALSLIWSAIKLSQPVGHILLDLGTPYTELYQASGVFLVFGAAMGIGLIILEKRDSVEYWLIAAYLVLGAAHLYLMSKHRLVLTRAGIHLGTGLLRWNQIELYEWERRAGKVDTLWLQLKKRIPLFKMTTIRVLSKYQSAVDELLSEYVSKPPAQHGVQPTLPSCER